MAGPTSANPYGPAATRISAQGLVTDLDVELHIDHNRFSDVDLMLHGPQGQQVMLISDAGGSSGLGGGASIVLDDSASTGVPDPVTRKLPRAGTTYTAVVTTSVTDLAGNRLDQVPGKVGLQPKRWRFTTR